MAITSRILKTHDKQINEQDNDEKTKQVNLIKLIRRIEREKNIC